MKSADAASIEPATLSWLVAGSTKTFVALLRWATIKTKIQLPSSSLASSTSVFPSEVSTSRPAGVPHFNV